MESDAASRFAEALRTMFSPESPGALGRAVSEKISSDDEDETELVETTEEDDAPAKEAQAPPPPHINFFQHPNAHPVVLDILLLQKYGPEWMLWEPETLQWRIPQDFRTSDISDLNMSKVQAMKTLHVIDTPWTEWEVFLWCAMPLNGQFPDFDMMQVPKVEECLLAIDTFNKVRADVAWGDEVKVYLSSIWRNESVFCPFSPADFFEVDKSGTTVDCSKISEAWPAVRKSGVAPMEDTADAEQLRRMLDAHNYLQIARDQFEQQLRLVLGT